MHPPGSLADLQGRYGTRHRWLMLMTVMIGSMAAIMSSTIMNVGIPDMSAHFELSPSRAQWVTSGFMVTMTVGMLMTPWMLMRFGYRRTYQICMWLLLAGGIAGGGPQPLVGGMDMTVRRNAFGRQRASFQADKFASIWRMCSGMWRS